MTKAEAKVLLAVKTWWELYHFGPSYDDIRFVLLQDSKSNVHRLVKSLCKQGYLKRTPGKSRSVRVVRRKDGH
jgi:SOS-response transcriptional repressor LexA